MLPSFFWFSIVPLSERPLLGLCRPRSPIPSPRKPAPHLCARSSDCDSSRPTPAGRSPADDSSRHNVMTRVVSCVHPSLLRVFHGSLAATAPASESWLAPSAAPSLAYGCREPRHFFSQLRAVYIDLRSLRIPRLSRPVRRASRIATSESPSTEPLLRLSPCAPRCAACSTNLLILDCLPQSNSSDSFIVRTPKNLCNAISALPPCSCPCPSQHKSLRMPHTHAHCTRHRSTWFPYAHHQSDCCRVS